MSASGDTARQSRGRRLPAISSCVLLAGLLLSAPGAPLFAQSIGCDDVLKQAERAFFNGRFDETTTLLERCLNEDSFDREKEAYLLMARVYYATQKARELENAFSKLLDLDPDYELEGMLPPPFVALFEEVRSERADHLLIAEKLRPAPEYNRPRINLRALEPHWYWIGGGVLAIGTAAVLVDGEIDRPAVFPPPPGPPGD